MYTKEKIDQEQESVLCNDTAFTIQLGKKMYFSLNWWLPSVTYIGLTVFGS